MGRSLGRRWAFSKISCGRTSAIFLAVVTLPLRLSEICKNFGGGDISMIGRAFLTILLWCFYCVRIAVSHEKYKQAKDVIFLLLAYHMSSYHLATNHFICSNVSSIEVRVAHLDYLFYLAATLYLFYPAATFGQRYLRTHLATSPRGGIENYKLTSVISPEC